jgi:hypothetical protein
VAHARPIWVVAAATVLLTAMLVVAAPALAATTEYVKYYVVAASYQGTPENLAEIAGRFLGASSRAGEILDLNTGRRQPDGGTVTASGRLHTGWSLILPWDAVGSGVRYGTLPTTMPAATTRPTPPAGPATPTPSASPRGGCAAPPVPAATSDWAANRVNAASAWTQTRGRGVLVAVVDSGVDSAASQLGDHLAPGADIVTGTGTGEVDCLGSGTAMAAIVAAPPAGVAPEAMVMPVRVVGTAPRARPEDVATGIEVATSAGAGVIAVGTSADPHDPAIAGAITTATMHDVAVVVGASTGPPASGVLRVGAVDSGNRMPGRYPAAAVDVVAPGVDVAVLGRARSGPQYAVAYVAGEVALVRSAYPTLTAAEAAHRVLATAQSTGTGVAMIDPGQAVERALPEEAHPLTTPAPPASAGTGNGHLVLIVVGALALVAVVVVLFRLRRPAGGHGTDQPAVPEAARSLTGAGIVRSAQPGPDG